MIKLVAIDLDGTLINSKSRISNKNIRAINKCLKKDIKIVLVSAKSIYAVKKVAKIFKLNNPHIAFGGAAIIDKNFDILLHL